MSIKKCLFCYEPLNDSDSNEMHKSCSRKIFGTNEPPEIGYSLSEMNTLAKEIVVHSVTVTGVQAKISLNLKKSTNGNMGRLTLVGLWGNFILKPPTDRYPEMVENEDLTMHLAQHFGLVTVPHTLIRLKSGELSYLTKRVDRDKKGNPIHMEDLCQLTERLTEDKYKGSMENIAKTIKKYSTNTFFDIVTFFELSLFSFLTGNGDMHLKNFSLIHNENSEISLCPAYDLLSTRLIIPENEDNEEFALTLNGKKRKLKLDDFNAFAKQIGINEKQIQNIYSRYSHRMKASFKIINQSFLSDTLKEEYKNLLRLRAKRLKLFK